MRDGERYQTSRIEITPIAEYLVEESYAVDYEPVTVPMKQQLGYQDSETDEIFCYADESEACTGCYYSGDIIMGCSPADTLFEDCFKVNREKKTTMYGTGVEYVEQNSTYFVRNYGIVKDEMEFRWNVAPGAAESFEGRYKVEMIEDRNVTGDCSGEGLLQTLIGNKEVIEFNEFDQIDKFNYDPYKKTRTYGMQRVTSEESQ